MKENSAFRHGVRDGIPIALGYFAVSFSLGFSARSATLTPLQGFVCSLLGLASAGEYAAFTVIAADATYLEMALITLIADARYMLMSAALSQRVDPGMPFYHRLFMAQGITDEIFGIEIAQIGWVNPFYAYGAMAVSAPAWAVGTALGIIAGSFLPARVVSALSVALFGMFLAIIIPPCRTDRTVAVLVVLGFFLSWVCSVWSVTKVLSDGTRTIILTVILAGAAALVKPVPVRDGEGSRDA